ncbi:hypothetical protein TrVFT333_002922 [Trichoderma virens FT-333]|nr:hypothetical protein TrVFT333_002922 [Trichoderma virens FT-333]
MQLKRAARVILVGAPGVGKGTQSDRLLKRFPQLKAISTGDLLRHNVKNRTPLGIMAENTIKAGGLVADDLMLRLISGELRSRGWLRPPVMTLSAEATSTEASFHSSASMDAFNSLPFQLDDHAATTLDKIVPMNLVVSIQTPFSVILERIAGRWVHEPSGRVYNTSFNRPRVPGRDDVTGEPSEPILNHYAKKGVLLEVEGMSSDEITPKLYKAFEKRFA